MLQAVCEYIHNKFISAERSGRFTIDAGMIPGLDLLDGQRFWIIGSVLNDGVYTWHANAIKDDDDIAEAGLRDETFDGSVLAMAVPPAVIALSEEIRIWVEKYGDVVNNPYQEENVIGVYSYTKAQNSKVDGGDPTMGWQTQFAKRLNTWRKMP